MSEIRPHYSSTRSVLADVIPLPMPYSIQIEASQICNLRCNYCVQSLHPHHRQELMSGYVFSKLLNRLLDFDGKLKTINFAGWGEPLINPNLASMVKSLDSMNLTENISVVTNGLLLHPDLSVALVEAGVGHIRISLQGMTSAKYREVSGKNIDFKLLVTNIKFLYDHRQDCRVSVKIADVALDGRQREQFYATFHDITDDMYVEQIRPMFRESAQDGQVVSKYGVAHPPVLACPLPFYMMAVTATGDIMPCCAYDDPCELGNIDTVSLKQVWEGQRLKYLQLMMLDGERKKQWAYTICRRCLMPDAVITPGDELDDRLDEIRRRM